MSLDEFDQFWQAYPRRVAKFAAVKAFSRARKQASFEDIMVGLQRYKASKPDWQHWAYAGSWLNGGRWLDELPDLTAGKVGWRPAQGDPGEPL